MNILKTIALFIFAPILALMDKERMNRHVNDIHSKVMHLSHFDEGYEQDYDFDEGYEMDSFEVENLMEEYENNYEDFKRKGATSTKARQLAHTKMSRKHGNKFKRATKSKTSLLGRDPHFKSAATFNITITRQTATIAQELPVALFAAIYALGSSYAEFIRPLLPSGVTLVSAAPNATNPLRYDLTYTDGTNTDIVSIVCNEAAYGSFLYSTLTDMMRITKQRYTIPDTTKLSQFSKKYVAVTQSLFGLAKQNPINVQQYKNPQQFQNGIIDILQPVDIDKETGLVTTILASAGFEFTLSLFVQNFHKHDKRDLRG